MTTELRPEDMDAAVLWLDGELKDPERLQFELRLAAEPELARAVEALAATDDWMRQHGARATGSAPELPAGRVLFFRRLFLAAAAIAAIVCAERWLWRDEAESRATLDYTAGVIESFESAREFADRHTELAGLHTRGFEDLRGDSPANVEPAEFVQKSEGVLRELRERATSETQAGYFALPLAIPAEAGPSEVIAVAIPEVGRELLLVPEPAGFGAPSAPTALVLEPGLHWLPRAPFELARSQDGAEEVRYSRGFLVPLGARSLTVLVGVRPASAPATALDPQRELRDVGSRFDEVARWKHLFEGAGFAVRELAVREP